MRRVKLKYIVLLIVAVLAFGAYWYHWGSSQTLPGQPPLTSLVPSNLDQFKSAFNDAADRPRLVLLVAPAVGTHDGVVSVSAVTRSNWNQTFGTA